MAFTVEDLIDSLRSSRRHFLKHLEGVREDQWDWKPYPECKSILETLAHLISDDRAAPQSMEMGKEPDYDALQESETDLARLCALMDEAHERLCTFIKTRFASAPLDTEVSAYGSPMKLGSAIACLTSEDYYHAGQVAIHPNGY